MADYVPGTEEKDPKKVIMALQQQARTTSGLATDVAALEALVVTATATTAGIVKRPTMAIIREEQTSTTNGGGFTSGADQTRVLNTEVSDLDGIVSISSNQFTLQAGTWLIEWSAPAYKVDQHQSWLYDVTGAAVRSRGTSEFSSAASDATTRSMGRAIVTITGATAYEIRHRCVTTKGTNGFGVQAGLGTEVYTEIIIHSYNQ